MHSHWACSTCELDKLALSPAWKLCKRATYSLIFRSQYIALKLGTCQAFHVPTYFNAITLVFVFEAFLSFGCNVFAASRQPSLANASGVRPPPHPPYHAFFRQLKCIYNYSSGGAIPNWIHFTSGIEVINAISLFVYLFICVFFSWDEILQWRSEMAPFLWFALDSSLVVRSPTIVIFLSAHHSVLCVVPFCHSWFYCPSVGSCFSSSRLIPSLTCAYGVATCRAAQTHKAELSYGSPETIPRGFPRSFFACFAFLSWSLLTEDMTFLMLIVCSLT